MSGALMRARSVLIVAIVAVTMAAGCAKSTQSQLFPANGPLSRGRFHEASAVETVLYSFGGHKRDGQWPRATLISVNGTLYGTTYGGGTHHGGLVCGGTDGCGTVFSITPSGTETVLYRLFAGGPHGAHPWGELINFEGKLYGTTAYGGFNECPSDWGCGTVFSIATTGAEKVLHRFTGSGGAYPQAGLVNVNGTFYGTTASGGSTNCDGGCGTVFSITPSGTYHLLYSFAGGNDGANPLAELINVNGILYGTTFGGGRQDDGTVFSITTSGSEKVLHAFTGSGGKYPQAGLVDVNGTFYGTTESGSHSEGTVFSVTPTGTEKVLHRFTGGSDGANPYADLINVNGTLYGTTVSGGGGGCGSGGCGTVFSITTAGGETVLHSFAGGNTGDGQLPQAGLLYVDGTLYGTTGTGGASGEGTVYTITGF
jgi:uncharacterized repeat protein (TIGR03803 family)